MEDFLDGELSEGQGEISEGEVFEDSESEGGEGGGSRNSSDEEKYAEWQAACGTLNK